MLHLEVLFQNALTLYGGCRIKVNIFYLYTRSTLAMYGSVGRGLRRVSILVQSL